VLVAGAVADKAARLVALSDAVVVEGPGRRYVSRGGVKLEAALERFGIDVHASIALDAGASTGGFTDCLLQRGASFVYAVDVGHGQLDPRLRADARVEVLERTNIRDVDPAHLSRPDRPFHPVDLVTADLAFISLRAVMPVLTGPVIRRGGSIVVLVKPQFEAGRREVSRGKGVVRDPVVWRQALVDVGSAMSEAETGIMGVMVSPILGPAGNAEFLLYGIVGANPSDRSVSESLFDEVISAASELATHPTP
jgi:23S rRNA (cytidine1920-2'-O)/16S rRNA (cytidine1409-2'-O)-methyltransferase